VTSPGNALLYEEPLRFPHSSFFSFASAGMHFCIEDTSLFRPPQSAFLYRGPLHLSHHCFLFVVNPPENALWYRRHLRFLKAVFVFCF
jgi:hypothetical protein